MTFVAAVAAGLVGTSLQVHAPHLGGIDRVGLWLLAGSLLLALLVVGWDGIREMDVPQMVHQINLVGSLFPDESHAVRFFMLKTSDENEQILTWMRRATVGEVVVAALACGCAIASLLGVSGAS